MIRLRILAILLFVGAVVGFGSGFRHLAGGGSWHGHACERAAAEPTP